MIGRLEVLPGPGTAARYGEVTVWAGAGASTDLLAFLIQSARNLAPVADGGRRIADHLAGVLRQRDPEPTVPFVTVGPGEYTPVTLLHGPVQLWDGGRWVRPDPGIGWLVAEVSNLTTVLVTPNDTPAPPSANPILDLQLGVVPGGGLAVVLTPASMMAADEPREGGPPATGSEAAGEVIPTGRGSTRVAGGPGAPAPDAAAPQAPVPDADGLAGDEPAGRDAEVIEATGTAGPAAGQPQGDPATAPAAAPRPHAEEDEAGRHPLEEPQAVGIAGTPLPDSEPHPPEAPAGTVTEDVPSGPSEAPVEPIGKVDLRTAPTESWTPLPPAEAGPPSPPGSVTVRGLRCPRGHFNHGMAVTCANCGLPLDPIRGQGDGPRPVLGVLVGTDRSLWRIDASYVAGTDPESDPAVVGGRARALVVPDDGQAQAVHAELRATDWTFSVVDRDSRSGTFVLPPGHSDWQRVPPDQPVTVKPGTHVAIGSTVFTFASPWPL